MSMDAALAPEKRGGDGAAGAGVVVATAAAAAQQAGSGAERRSRFRRICVYCGSAKGRKPSYQDAAVELGRELVRSHLPRNSRLCAPENTEKIGSSLVKSLGVGYRFLSSHLIAPLRPVRCRRSWRTPHSRVVMRARGSQPTITRQSLPGSCPSGGTERRRNSLPFRWSWCGNGRRVTMSAAVTSLASPNDK
jgi:hypothetical protein